MRRLLIYSHDTFGLGNMRRMTAIARHLRDANPDLTILMVSGSNALPAFDLPSRIDYVKLPCLARNTEGRYNAKSLCVDLDDIIQLRANIILSVMLDFQPDMILVDKKPFGVSNELQPVLDVISRRTHAPKLVLLLRDILDEAESTSEIWQRNGYHDAIENFYDAILVVGDPAVYDLSREYKFPQSTQQRIRYCGYISKPAPSTPKIYRSEPLVLVTPGGGEDGANLIQTYIRSLQHAQNDFASMVVLGPDMAETDVSAIREQAEHVCKPSTSITIKRFTKHMQQYMSQASSLVTMGGYNTVYEGLSLHKRMVVVPRTTPSKEQEIRAERLTRLGHIQSIHPSELTPHKLADAVYSSLHDCARPKESICFRGLQNVQRELEHVAAGAM